MHNVAHVIHCDIKPENILVNTANEIKISDFGISTMIENKNEKLKKIGGTKLFLPPETWKGRLLLNRRRIRGRARRHLVFGGDLLLPVLQTVSFLGHGREPSPAEG